jgi:excisionase family DNA binding protein
MTCRFRVEVMTMENAFDLLTMKEVATMLHCSKAHVCNAVAGRVHGCAPIPAIHLGRRTLVRRETLLAWIEQNEHAGGTIQASPERGRKSA